jgi:hypothetical protein
MTTEDTAELNGQKLVKKNKPKKDEKAAKAKKPKKADDADLEASGKESGEEEEVRSIILTPEEKEKLRSEVRSYSDKIENHYFDLAALVYQVYDSASYLDWEGPIHDDETDKTEVRKYLTFAEYVENELCMGQRTADYFVSMSRFFLIDMQDHPEVTTKVKKLGWSKTKELVGVVNAENVDEWVEKAQKMTVSQLAAACRSALRGDDDKDDKNDVKRKSFTFVDDQIDVVENALDHAKETSGSDKDGFAMTLICQDYLAGAVRPKEGSQQLAYIKRMESILGGIKLIAVDADAKKVVYGKRTFSSLSED